MSTTTVDEALCARVRAAVEAARQAEYAVREAVAELDASDVVAASGYRSTARLLGDLIRVDPAVAKRLVTQAGLLTEGRAFSGEPLEAPLPATAEAFAAGAIDAEHVRVVARTMDAVSRVPDLGPDTVADAEALLARQATELPPCGVEKAATRLLAHLDPDGVAPLDPPEPDDEVAMATRRRDGALVLSGVIHGAADAELIREVFDALAVPAGPDDTRSLGARHAEVLLELAGQALAPTGFASPEPKAGPEPGADPEPGPEPEREREPRTGHGTADEPVEASPSPASVRAPGRALLAVTIEHRWLQLQVGHGLLDSDRTVSAAEARRLGCDAGIVPVVLGTRSQPLDVGRLSYTVPDGMRRALHLRDRGCTFPGCGRRPRRCAAHHVVHWADGGRTALDNVTLLCRYHHHLVHHDQWQVRMCGGRPWFTPPAWIDPTRTPRPGGPHPPDL